MFYWNLDFYLENPLIQQRQDPNYFHLFHFIEDPYTQKKTYYELSKSVQLIRIKSLFDLSFKIQEEKNKSKNKNKKKIRTRIKRKIRTRTVQE